MSTVLHMSIVFFVLMSRQPPISTLIYPLFPYTTLFRSSMICSTSAYGNGSTSSCSRWSASTNAGGSRSARLDRSWPSLTYVGPSRSRSAASSSEEHTSELQSLMRSSYAVFCLNKKIDAHKELCRHLYTSIVQLPYQ